MSDKEKPVERFCLACEKPVVATHKDFRASGHVADANDAKRVYGMSGIKIARIEHKLASGAYAS